MIDLRGMTQEQAEKAIVGLGLTVGTVDHSSSDMPAGQVWFQSVEPKGRGSPGDQGEYHHQHRFCRGKPTELQDDHL
ncbi:MAG: PASTA domain-containing protein [Lawsonibacter sp.]